MHRSLVFFLTTVMISLISSALIAQQQTPPTPQRPRRGQRPPAGMDRAAMQQRMEQFRATMMNRMLESAKLTQAEQTAARKAMQRKQKAATKLREELRKLGQAAMKEGASEAELKIALELFQKALTRYRKEIAAADAQLVEALSLRAKARLTALGVLDNGLAAGGGRMMGGMGMGMDPSRMERFRRTRTTGGRTPPGAIPLPAPRPAR